jgi:hypothetical protein
VPQAPSYDTADKTLEMALLFAEAKGRCRTKEELDETFKGLGVSRPVGYKMLAIADAAPALKPVIDSLPPSYHALYALRQVAPDTLHAWVKDGRVTADSSVRAISDLVAQQTAAPTVAKRLRSISNAEELGTLLCSPSFNHRPFLKELEALLEKHSGIQWVPSGAMGTRALTQEELDQERERASDLLQTSSTDPELTETLTLTLAYLDATDRQKRRRAKIKLNDRLDGATARTRNLFEKQFPTVRSFLD